MIENLMLEADVNIVNVQDLQDILKGILANQRIVIDVSAVQAIDTASLQLLLSFVMYCRKKEVHLSFVNGSDVWSKQINLAGLKDYIL